MQKLLIGKGAINIEAKEGSSFSKARAKSQAHESKYLSFIL